MSLYELAKKVIVKERIERKKDSIPKHILDELDEETPLISFEANTDIFTGTLAYCEELTKLKTISRGADYFYHYYGLTTKDSKGIPSLNKLPTNFGSRDRYIHPFGSDAWSDTVDWSFHSPGGPVNPYLEERLYNLLSKSKIESVENWANYMLANIIIMKTPYSISVKRGPMLTQSGSSPCCSFFVISKIPNIMTSNVSFELVIKGTKGTKGRKGTKSTKGITKLYIQVIIRNKVEALIIPVFESVYTSTRQREPKYDGNFNFDTYKANELPEYGITSNEKETAVALVKHNNWVLYNVVFDYDQNYSDEQIVDEKNA